jgi:hypothetical protein
MIIKRTLNFALGTIIGGVVLSAWDIYIQPLHNYEFSDKPSVIMALLAVCLVAGIGSALFLLASFIMKRRSGILLGLWRFAFPLIFGIIYISVIILWPNGGWQPSFLGWVWLILIPIIFGGTSALLIRKDSA